MLRVNLKYSLQTKSDCEMTDMLITWTVVIVSQRIHISKHQIVHLKEILFLFFNCNWPVVHESWGDGKQRKKKKIPRLIAEQPSGSAC